MCKSKSASDDSSNVDLNASMSVVGNFLINPTVSEITRSCPCSINNLREVVSSVANNLFSANIFSLVSLLNKVDLPAFVYPTIAIVNTFDLLRALR